MARTAGVGLTGFGVNVRLSNGRYLLTDKTVSAFTNDEERAVKLDQTVPFLLESKLVERGARFEGAPNWQRKVVVSERLVRLGSRRRWFRCSSRARGETRPAKNRCPR